MKIVGSRRGTCSDATHVGRRVRRPAPRGRSSLVLALGLVVTACSGASIDPAELEWPEPDDESEPTGGPSNIRATITADALLAPRGGVPGVELPMTGSSGRLDRNTTKYPCAWYATRFRGTSEERHNWTVQCTVASETVVSAGVGCYRVVPMAGEAVDNSYLSFSPPLSSGLRGLVINIQCATEDEP